MNEALKRAQKEYNNKCYILNLRLNKETDADIIYWLEHQPNKAAAIKELIRAEI